MKNSLFQKKPRQILAVLLFVPALMLAQSSSENYVRAETMLNADGNNAMGSHGVGSFDHYDKIIMSLINDANNSLSGIGMQIVFKRTGSDTDSYNLKVVR